MVFYSHFYSTTVKVERLLWGFKLTLDIIEGRFNMEMETADRKTERSRVGGEKVSFLTKWEKSLLQILTHIYLCHPTEYSVPMTVEITRSLKWNFYFFTVWHSQPHVNVTAKSTIFTLLWNENLKYEENVTSTSCHDSHTAQGNILFHTVKLNEIWKNTICQFKS